MIVQCVENDLPIFACNHSQETGGVACVPGQKRQFYDVEQYKSRKGDTQCRIDGLSQRRYYRQYGEYTILSGFYAEYGYKMDALTGAVHALVLPIRIGDCKRPFGSVFTQQRGLKKWNDTAVSERCKHQGMSWMESGVLAMALHASEKKRDVANRRQSSPK